MLFHTIAGILQVISTIQNCYFLHWNFDWNRCFVMFFHEWNEWKNPQFNFSSQYLSIERNFFKWDGKVTKISHLLFHRIRKNFFFFYFFEKKEKKCSVFFLKKLIISVHNRNLGRTSPWGGLKTTVTYPLFVFANKTKPIIS